MRLIKEKTKWLLLSVMMILSLTACGVTTDDETTGNQIVTTTEAPTTEAPTTEEPTTVPFVPTEVDIVMIGDMLMHMGVQNSGKLDDGTYNYDHLFTHIKDDVQSADIAIANQEVMLGGVELGLSGYPNFNCAYEVGDALVDAGFNVILHATNHTLDKGKKGVDNTLNYWKTKHPDITYLGINETAEDQDKIYVFEKEGIKIAILNYTYGTNGIALPADRPFVVNLLEEEKVLADLKKANEMADFVVVCPHWGSEYTLVETDYQRHWAQLFADNGVDLVLGAHPHVVEPVTWVEGKDGQKMLCYYSVGNYVSTQQKASTMLGAMAKVTLTNDESGNVFIKTYEIEPLVTHRVLGTQKITTYKLSDYTSELVSKNTILNYASEFSMKYLYKTCKQVFGDLYIPKGEALKFVEE